MPRRLLRAVAAGALATTALAGCSFSHLQFRSDKRLSFTAPAARSQVTVPFTVSWSMKDVTAGSTYAVFVDKSPISVGHTLRDVGKNDPSCEKDARCPDVAYLNSHDIYLTATPDLDIPTLPKVKDGVGDEQHSVTVVLLDSTGHRIGESAWYQPFTLKRRS